MLKAVMRDGDGQPVVVLGLSGENMTRLMADEPILVNLEELKLPPLRILLTGGRDEEQLLARLVAAGVPLQGVKVDKRLPDRGGAG